MLFRRDGQQEALDRATIIFTRLGDIAQVEGTVIAVEANPAVYGTNFLTQGEQALEFARRVGHPAVRFILDIGAMHINNVFEHTPTLIKEAGDLLSHVHFSEPQLAPAPADAAMAALVLSALDAAQYSCAVSIEMKSDPDEPIKAMAAAIERLSRARQTYGSHHTSFQTLQS